jgi:hypothetical protein
MIADLALNRAKQGGRNRALFLEAAECLPRKGDEIARLTTDLNYALERGFLRIGSESAGLRGGSPL